MSKQSKTQEDNMSTQDYGTVEYNGKELRLLQQPYIDGGVYAASATDGVLEYDVLWRIKNPDCEDESEACDWDNYRVIVLGTI